MFAWYALMSHSWRAKLFSMGAAWSATFVDNPRDTFGILAYLDGFLAAGGLAVRVWNRATPARCRGGACLTGRRQVGKQQGMPNPMG